MKDSPFQSGGSVRLQPTNNDRFDTEPLERQIPILTVFEFSRFHAKMHSRNLTRPFH